MNAPIARHERRFRVALATALTAALACGIAAPAHAEPADSITPVPDAWGRYFVDSWNTNESANRTPETNAAIGLLSPMLQYWTPEDSPTAEFDANGKFLPESVGTVKNRTVLDANIAESARITRTRTPEQAIAAYLTDRRNQNYSAIAGLGPYAAEFRTGTNAGTSIPDEIPADATTVKYDDAGNSNRTWADTGTTYGAMVELVNTFRASSASTNPSKAYYNYARPFRWSDDVHVLPTLEPAKKSDAEWKDDGGYPSGHTNAGWLATYALAYATPERFQELLTSGSEIGNTRIVAGMHSPADVIGGRMMSTAVAAAALNNPVNAELKQRALDAAAALLETTPAADDAFADGEANEALYAERLTYGLPRVGDTTLPVAVPKGAEVLLETRQPYLTADQRRWVLQSTGLESGYALLDDAEGWGRLNLYAAADGYSAFVEDVTVDMDAADGGFSAADTWSNDIEGPGALTKTGTGSLTLAGDNSYTGDTIVEGGELVASSATALGAGSLTVDDAIVSETATAPVVVAGDLTVGTGGELRLTVDSAEPALRVAGDIDVDGSLTVTVADGFVPADDVVIATYAGSAPAIDEDAVRFTGLPAGYTPTLEARDGVLRLINATPALEALTAGTPSIHGAPVVGDPLTLTPGTWGPAPVQLSYQWYRGSEVISGATGLAYTPVEADLGQRLSATVTGTKAGFASLSLRADASGVVTAGSPTASPTPTVRATPPASGALAATGAEAPALLPIVALGILALGAAFVAVRVRVTRSRRS
ncbi:acid phosphatase [Microbacterium hatanonis]|uniref:Phosphatase PAP2 family protein n=1 Tax=Microbacterium hatanonis TaxID=404366 RepID=A0A5C8HYW5_9MICO|nr:phosphatase PAP2 family protein [Microbacterium hatanonis]TXK10412.1 phosphatase PAP2 family protein [Microbacterium hatanonis]